MLRFALIPLLLVALPASAEVYKCVDEDGTVIFTDQKCSDDAQPMDLPELTVMDAPKPKPAASPEGEGDQQPETIYPSLTMLSPKREETFQGTGNTLPLRLATKGPLRSGDKVVVFLDDQEQGSFNNLSVDLQQVPRGTHQVRVEIRDDQGRVVGQTASITFHMKQHSRLHQNQPLVNPSSPGGGS